VKYWEIIADNLSKAGWSLSFGLARPHDLDADAQRTAFRRRDVRADEKLTAFLELGSRPS
jgi:hypothetical protein